jgi:hypothetical protein
MIREAWDARIERAEQPAARGEASSELLKFYGELLRAQKEAYEYLRGRKGWLPYGGQKLYFWLIVVSAVLFLLTGLPLWFDDVVPRWSVAVSYVVHDIAALVMLAGFIVHVYEGTAAQPGTFRSMVDGTVARAWAWTHHPAWYRDVTGRDPREDYERELRRQVERGRAAGAWEREQDERERAGRAGPR